MEADERWLRVRLCRWDAPSLASLFDGIGAREVICAGDGATRMVTARFDPEDPPFLEDRLAAFLHVLDPKGAARLETRAGVGEWRPGWRGLYFGATVGPFRVRPPWAPPTSGALDICLDPLRAFGSGLHPTTRLALEALAQDRDERGRGPGTTHLDVGAGSGVLAIAGARLGYAPRALEHEPQALRSCRETVRANGFELETSDDSLRDLDARFSVVTANLEPVTVRALAEGLAAVTAPGGTLLVAGFRLVDTDDVRARFPLAQRRRGASPDGEWGLLVLDGPALV